MESNKKILIPDWEDSLPAHARTTPQVAEESVRAALLEQVESD
jgi:hypothetical protein